MTPRTTRLNIRSAASRKGAAWRAKHQQTEEQFHLQVRAYLDTVLPDDAFWTTFPAGGGGKVRGAQLKAKGLRAGVPDVLIVHEGIARWIELKAPKGRVGIEQTITHADLVRAGSPVAVCRTLDGIHEALTRWGFRLKGRLAA